MLRKIFEMAYRRVVTYGHVAFRVVTFRIGVGDVEVSNVWVL